MHPREVPHLGQEARYLAVVSEHATGTCDAEAVLDGQRRRLAEILQTGEAKTRLNQL